MSANPDQARSLGSRGSEAKEYDEQLLEREARRLILDRRLARQLQPVLRHGRRLQQRAGSLMVKIVGLAPKPSPHVVGRPQPPA